MFNPLQTVTLHAFLTALVELDSPLPIALQQEINKVGEMLANAQNDDALNRLIELAENAIATMILEELEDEHRWDELFARSPDMLAKLRTILS
ncbi:hypothetical protein [Nostoc sp. 'Lobaria pulmonaria (5183) cyanobiont']|uniref:hypothetical protein n=1 Tax=Nostoc sp. 'Lobaria pulmonaria (5183) cyanobiont' TaxID=1618022 RepID=UPI000CF316A8|nr:hypothetical protein [Nostoc sp. 'Lobaria pulmonaria (5183) cyanobiont']AVH71311.1 hypothetical protein NLP_2665 [Nostoc sp. 'Lobaria pulmonaria (5183) cyanobiont']